MFRQAAIRLAMRQQRPAAVRDMMTTAAQKRALNKQQLAGTKKEAAPKPSGGESPPPPPPPPPPSSSGGGGNNNNNMFMGVAAAAALGVGGYVYYQKQQQPEETVNEMPGMLEKEVEIIEEKKAEERKPEPVKAEKVETPQEEEKVAAVPEEVAVPAPLLEVEAPKGESAGHRVTTIVVPPTVDRPKGVTPEVSHPSDGHRVAMAPPSQQQEAAVVWTAEVAAKELMSQQDDAASETLQKAHRALRANLDESLLQDLDSLKASELKIRIVQLAAEMKERTKWEAVRLKEFLAMKEKETADKYMDILQKQRIEFESLLARRLLEQEEALTRQANAALQEKENNIQAVVKAAAEAQEAEHEADLKSTQERLERELNAKYETDYSTKLANEKAGFLSKLQAKVAAVQELSEKLQQLESSLEASKTFESGSQRAHRVSAAAMAFASKAETNKGAASELAALQVAAGNDGVIASALAVIPASAKTGIPTLAELQAKFETVQRKARQAAMVPDGWNGLEGQLMGMAFSTLKLNPSPDEAVPNQDEPDYVLVRAQRHVQLGELDRAVEQLDKLDGQAAFTVRDWKQAAKDRISMENALKVIKMECALLNESHSGGE